MRKKIIFFDNEMISVDENRAARLNPGVMKGQGVFETMRSYSGHIFLLHDHLKRLRRGLTTLHMPVLYTPKELESKLYEVLKRNRLKNARLRLVVWEHKGKQHITITAAAYAPLSRQKYKAGFRGMTCHCRKEFIAPSLKSIDYTFFLRKYENALQKGYDEALLLNSKKEIVEGSRTNIFVVKKDVLITPGLKSGCLLGITRDMVLKIAKKNSIKYKAGFVNSDAFYNADEAFLTNSVLEIMPLTSVNGKSIGAGRLGKVTAELMSAYKKLTLNS